MRPAGRDIPDPAVTTAAITSRIKSSPVLWTTTTERFERFSVGDHADAARQYQLPTCMRIMNPSFTRTRMPHRHIFAFVDDLFFLAKIQEVARKLNVKVEFVKTDKDILDRVRNNGDEKPSLIIIDLNNLNAKPLTIIPKLKKELKKGTAIIGFVSHVQGELKLKAQEAGCDMVLPRSAFSQNLPSLLRRHGTAAEAD